MYITCLIAHKTSDVELHIFKVLLLASSADGANDSIQSIILVYTDSYLLILTLFSS